MSTGAEPGVPREPTEAADDRSILALLDDLRRENESLRRQQRDLEERLLALESSRFFRLLQLPGRCFTEWRSRLGQALLHSPLHPLYLRLLRPGPVPEAYKQWLECEPVPTQRRDLTDPLISVVMPVHNPNRVWLEAAVASVLRQTYPSWELCVCDDGSGQAWVSEYFGDMKEGRIHFLRLERSIGIAGATTAAAKLASGAYVCFLDQDDLLAPFALQSVAEAAQDGAPDLIYSDEDLIDEDGRRLQPIFRPAYSPDLLRCCMYMGHLLTVRRSRLEDLGWLRPEMDGSQDHELALRLAAGGGPVRHIPLVLYHWRQHSGSTAAAIAAKPYAHAAGERAVAEVVKTRHPDALVAAGDSPCTYKVRWPIPAGTKASLIVCSRNPKLLRSCLRGIARCTRYTDREVVVVQHKVGKTAAMDRLVESLPHLCIPYSGVFNFSRMNNIGATRAGGEVLVFLNDDVQPLAAGWLDQLVAHALRPEIGVVGAKLVYPSGSIQHVGIALGIMDGTGHPHRFTFASPFWRWLEFTRNVAAVTGACLAIRRTVFEKLGGFDEMFPVNYNDVDLCLRARRAGYEVIIEPAAVLRHFECRTRQRGVRWDERRRFESRWGDWLAHGDPFYTPHLAATGEHAVLDHAQRQPLDAFTSRSTDWISPTVRSVK